MVSGLGVRSSHVGKRDLWTGTRLAGVGRVGGGGGREGWVLVCNDSFCYFSVVSRMF